MKHRAKSRKARGIAIDVGEDKGGQGEEQIAGIHEFIQTRGGALGVTGSIGSFLQRFPC
jgi:hypothetical protein